MVQRHIVPGEGRPYRTPAEMPTTPEHPRPSRWLLLLAHVSLRIWPTAWALRVTTPPPGLRFMQHP